MPMIEHPTEWPGAAKAALTHKVGPLPVWGWVAVAVGGVAAFVLIGKRSGSTVTTAGEPVAVTDTADRSREAPPATRPEPVPVVPRQTRLPVLAWMPYRAIRVCQRRTNSIGPARLTLTG